MSVISNDEKLIKLFYNSDSNVGKQTFGYLHASEKDLIAIDTKKTLVTGTQWADLADHLNKTISDLVHKEHPSFLENYEAESEFSDEDWIKILQKHPEVFVYPIVINGKLYKQIINYPEVYNFIEVDSENLDEQNPD